MSMEVERQKYKQEKLIRKIKEKEDKNIALKSSQTHI